MTTDLTRAFIAIEVNVPDVVEKIAKTQQALESSGSALLKSVERENLHLTLKFLGEIDRVVLQRVSEAVAGVIFSPFELGLEGLGYFPGGGRVNVIWVGVRDSSGQLQQLSRQVQASLSRLGFPPERFDAHLTIARVKAVRDKARLIKTIAEHANETYGAQTVREIVLKKSVLTSAGPRYTDLVRHDGVVR